MKMKFEKKEVIGDGNCLFRSLGIALNEKHEFNSGDFIVDYYNLMKHVIINGISRCSFSSSIDHIFFDYEGFFEKRVNSDTLEFVSPMSDEGHFNIVCLEEHKNFNDVKEYVALKEKELGLS